MKRVKRSSGFKSSSTKRDRVLCIREDKKTKNVGENYAVVMQRIGGLVAVIV